MRHVLLMAVLALAGCSSMHVQDDIDALEEQQNVLSSTEGSYLEFNWIGEANSEQSPRMDAAVERVTTCVAPAATKLTQETAHLKDTYQGRSLEERYAAARPFVVRATQALDACASAEGLTGQIMFVVGKNQALPFADWLDEIFNNSIALRNKYIELHYARQNDMALAQALSAGLARGLSQPYNPSVIAVRPYVRRDGTFVNSYLRTTPNQTCADNLSGCRK